MDCLKALNYDKFVLGGSGITKKNEKTRDESMKHKVYKTRKLYILKTYKKFLSHSSFYL